MIKTKKIRLIGGFTLQEMVIVCAIVAILSTSIYLMFANGRKLFNLQNYTVIAENQALKASLIMQRELREARPPEGLDLLAIEEADTQSIIFYADITDEPVNNQEEKIQYLLHDGYLLRGIAYWNSSSGAYDDLPDLIHYNPGTNTPIPSTNTPTPSNSGSSIPSAEPSVGRSGSPTPTPTPSPSGSQTPASTNIQVMAQYVVNGTNPVFYYYDQDYTGSQSPLSYPINLGAIKIIKIHLEIDPNPGRPPEPYLQDTTIQFRNPNL